MFALPNFNVLCKLFQTFAREWAGCTRAWRPVNPERLEDLGCCCGCAAQQKARWECRSRKKHPPIKRHEQRASVLKWLQNCSSHHIKMGTCWWCHPVFVVWGLSSGSCCWRKTIHHKRKRSYQCGFFCSVIINHKQTGFHVQSCFNQTPPPQQQH